MSRKRHADIIKAFECADGSRSDGDDMSQVLHDPFDGTAAYGYIFGMHFMPFDRFALDRLECSGSDMQRQFFATETFGIQVRQHLRCEMKSRRRCGYRTFDFRINSLVRLQIAFLRFTVQIRRYGQFACRIQHFGKAETTVPTEPYLMCLSVALYFFCR